MALPGFSRVLGFCGKVKARDGRKSSDSAWEGQSGPGATAVMIEAAPEHYRHVPEGQYKKRLQ